MRHQGRVRISWSIDRLVGWDACVLETSMHIHAYIPRCPAARILVVGHVMCLNHRTPLNTKKVKKM